MEAFKWINIYPNFTTGHLIQWEIHPGLKFVGPINFTVEVAEEEAFTDIIISKEVGNSYFAIDNSNLKQALSYNYMYRVKLETGDGKIFYSRPLWAHSTPETKDRFQKAAELMRIEQNVTQRFAGRKAFFFKRRTFGELDKSSVSPVTGAVIASKPSNQGTQFLGGFHDPVLTSFRILTSEEGKTRDDSGRGLIEPYTYSAKMIGFPSASYDDLLVVVDDNKRYLVKYTKYFSIPGANYIYAQRLNLSLVPFTDDLYKLPVPIIGVK